MSGYDAHLFVKNLGVSKGNIKCIPKTDEKYISFSKEIVVDTFKDKKTGEEKTVKRELRFIDSYRFMLSSLDSLVNNLDKDNCKNIRLITKKREKLDLLLRKGVFPYEYMDSLDKMKETQLPPKSAFIRG